MLSDEEREALEILELYFGENSALNITKYVNIVLNLIEKQSKEIEELNKENTRQHELIGNIHQKWEDKIKAKIEEVQNMKAKAKDIVFKSSLNYIETELKSLLEKE